MLRRAPSRQARSVMLAGRYLQVALSLCRAASPYLPGLALLDCHAMHAGLQLSSYKYSPQPPET